MDILLAAVLGELTTRSINFFIKNSSKPKAPEVEDRLCRILLRVQVIDEEAIGRQITNHAVLQQLDMLRDAMHRGYYILDTFRYQFLSKEEDKGQARSHYLSVSKVNSLQGRLCSSSSDTLILEKMQKSLDDLSFMILDVKELVVFLVSYPRLFRRPYSTHLLLGNCMFGLQMETELVISFLLHARPHGSKELLEVLPIIGPCLVGKSTLVAHVCKDERVRDHFSEILFLHDHDFTADEPTMFRKGYSMMEHQNRVPNFKEDGRLLVVVELVDSLNEDVWNSLCSAIRHVTGGGSKIIVTSRSDKIVKFGTTRPLRMKYLSQEAYWYFFKAITFGGMDPKMHPRHAKLAMEMAGMLNGCFIGANMTACLLRDNFDIHFWSNVLAFLRGITKKHVSKSCVHPLEVMNQNRPAHLRRMATSSEGFVVYNLYQCSSQEEVPKIKILDVIDGRIKPHGKFDALAWRSQIPPYHSYANTCEIQELKTTGAKRKRSIVTRLVSCELNICE